MNGYDTGTVVVYDYNAGDTQGSGASLEGGRESSLNILTLADTQGTVWMDNDNILAFNTDGTLLSVNANTMTHQIVGTLPTPFAGSPNSALAYNPEVSPYVYALYSQFADVTTNTLYVVDPRADYSLVKTIDLSTSSNTARDVALDAAGNLFFSAFGSSSEGATIHVIEGAAQPETLTDNSSTVWYRAGIGASFSGLDVAFGSPPTPDVDLNSDGAVDAADAGLMFANWGQTGTGDLNSDSIIDAADAGILFAAWTGDAVPVSSIPEPTASGLLLFGVVAWRTLRTQSKS